jgi:hypothetical protein
VAAALVALNCLGPACATAAILEVIDCGDQTPGGGPGQLRTLITAASGGDTIVLPPCRITLTGAAGEDANASGDLDITTDLTLQGAGVGRTVLDGNGLDRVLHVVGGTAVIRDLTISNGKVADGGGGLKITGGNAVTLRRVEIQGNETTGALSAGGGVAAQRPLLIDESIVTGNAAPGGAGGGIAATDQLVVTRSTVSGNTAMMGGGISLDTVPSGPFRLLQSTVSGNHATSAADQGGGLLADGPGTKHVFHSTIVGNRTAQGTGGGMAVVGGPRVQIRASILSANVPASCGPGAAHSGGYNLSDESSCALAGPGDLASGDPLLTPLGAHGGPTPTHALRPGSPAIDQASELGCPAVDQRGVARPQGGELDGEVRCDIGAVERSGSTAARAPGE